MHPLLLLLLLPTSAEAGRKQSAPDQTALAVAATLGGTPSWRAQVAAHLATTAPKGSPAALWGQARMQPDSRGRADSALIQRCLKADPAFTPCLIDALSGAWTGPQPAPEVLARAALERAPETPGLLDQVLDRTTPERRAALLAAMPPAARAEAARQAAARRDRRATAPSRADAILAAAPAAPPAAGPGLCTAPQASRTAALLEGAATPGLTIDERRALLRAAATSCPLPEVAEALAMVPAAQPAALLDELRSLAAALPEAPLAQAALGLALTRAGQAEAAASVRAKIPSKPTSRPATGLLVRWALAAEAAGDRAGADALRALLAGVIGEGPDLLALDIGRSALRGDPGVPNSFSRPEPTRSGLDPLELVVTWLRAQRQSPLPIVMPALATAAAAAPPQASPDGASALAGPDLVLYDVKSGAPRAWIGGQTAAFSPDGQRLAAASCNGAGSNRACTLTLHDAATGALDRGWALRLPDPGGAAGVGLDLGPLPLAWAPDGQSIAVGLSHPAELVLLDASAGGRRQQPLAPIEGLSGSLELSALSWSGEALALELRGSGGGLATAQAPAKGGPLAATAVSAAAPRAPAAAPMHAEHSPSRGAMVWTGAHIVQVFDDGQVNRIATEQDPASLSPAPVHPERRLRLERAQAQLISPTGSKAIPLAPGQGRASSVRSLPNGEALLLVGQTDSSMSMNIDLSSGKMRATDITARAVRLTLIDLIGGAVRLDTLVSIPVPEGEAGQKLLPTVAEVWIGRDGQSVEAVVFMGTAPTHVRLDRDGTTTPTLTPLPTLWLSQAKLTDASSADRVARLTEGPNGVIDELTLVTGAPAAPTEGGPQPRGLYGEHEHWTADAHSGRRLSHKLRPGWAIGTATTPNPGMSWWGEGSAPAATLQVLPGSAWFASTADGRVWLDNPEGQGAPALLRRSPEGWLPVTDAQAPGGWPAALAELAKAAAAEGQPKP